MNFRRYRGKVSGGIWIKLLIVLALTVFGGALLRPIFIKARISHCPSACVANLKQVEGAKAVWAMEHSKQPSDVPLPEDLFGPDKYIREMPVCPEGGVYTWNRVAEPPTCTVKEHKLGR